MSERLRVITNDEVDARIADLEGQFSDEQYEYALVKPEEYTAAETDRHLETNIDTIDRSSSPEQHERWKQMTMFKSSGYDQVLWRLTKF